MHRPLLAGLVLVILTGAAQANPPPAPGSGRTPATETRQTVASRESDAETTAASKPAPPLARADKPDKNRKLNGLKVYPCF